MHKRKNEIRDIYQAQEHDFEKDFTPQVATEVFKARQRDLRRSRVFSVFFGVLAVALSIALIALVIRNLLAGQKPADEFLADKNPSALQGALPSDTLWIMDCQPEPAQSDLEEPVAGPKSLSTKWIKTAAYYTVRGQQSLTLNQQEEALGYFQKVVDLYPDIQGLHRAMGVLYLQRKNYELAADHLEKALKEEESFEAVINLGEACIGLKEYNRAEPHLKRALELQPGNPDCHKNLAELYSKMNRDNDAVFHFEKYIDLRPGDLDTQQSYALFLTKTGRWKDAVNALMKLTQDLPDVPPLYFLLAQAQAQNGQPDKAVETLKRGVQLIDPELALTWLNRDEFNALRSRDDFKRLADTLKKDTDTSPGS